MTGRCLAKSGLRNWRRGTRGVRWGCAQPPSWSWQRPDAEDAPSGNRRRRTGAAKDFQAWLFQREEIREGTDGLRLAEGQVPALAERVGKKLKRAALQLGGEVDQDVAAEDEVDTGKRRAVGEIVLAKHDQRADLLANFECAIDRGEVPGDEVSWQTLQRRLGIDTAARKLDRVASNVCRENADGQFFRVLGHEIQDQHGERVGFFDSGAPRRPDAKLTSL